jgi:Tfp pilus assembly protein PilO
MSEPTRLGEILPEVMKKIEKRVGAWAKMSDMKNQNQRVWRFDRRVNLSVLIQLVFLASLIVGSWVNLQSQLDLLQHDVTTLLQSQKSFEQKLESLQAKSISYEYRLRVIEKRLPEANIGDESF